MDQRDFIKAVNQSFDMVGLLRASGVRINRIPVTLRCPFHEDNSKSSKLYEDNKLWCWTCHKMYGPYDVLSQLLAVSDGEIRRKLSSLGSIALEEEEGFSVNEEAAKELKALFRLKEIPLRKMLDGAYLMMRGKRT